MASKYIRIELESLTVKHTKVINGVVVTRWSAESYEVGTWGRTTVNLESAVKEVAK